CQQGDANQGLFWLAQGLKGIAAAATEQQTTIRTRLSAWYPQVSQLRLRWQPPGLPGYTAFSKDLRLALTRSDQRTAQVWEVGTGNPFSPPLRAKAQLTALALSQDGRFAFTGTADKKGQFWEVATGKAMGKPFLHPGAVTWAHFAPDGETLLSS